VAWNSKVSFLVFLLAGTTGSKFELESPLIAGPDAIKASFGFSDSGSVAAEASSTSSKSDSAKKPSLRFLPFMGWLGSVLESSLFNPLASKHFKPCCHF
jgi:hypothetical protein